MTASIHSFLGEWSAAEHAEDAGKLDWLPTEDFAGIGPVGFLLSKAEWLTRHQQGLSYESFGPGRTTVRARGDVIITARLIQRGTAFCNPIPEAIRATCVLVRQGEQWRLASAHGSNSSSMGMAVPAGVAVAAYALVLLLSAGIAMSPRP